MDNIFHKYILFKQNKKTFKHDREMHDDLFWPRDKAGGNEMDAVWVSPRLC